MRIEEVRRYVAWATEGTSSGTGAVREMCGLLASLYAGIVSLSEVDVDRVPEPDESPPRRFDERTVRESLAARLPFQYYGFVSDPLAIPPVDPTIGDLFDDLIDLLNELQVGLDLYDRGSPDEALNFWWFGGRTHWFGHATAALVAGEAWLSRFDPAWIRGGQSEDGQTERPTPPSVG